MNKYLKTIWFWWILLTIIYSFLSLSLLDGGLLGRLTGFIGLFVPFGPLSVLVFFIGLPLSLISVLVFFGGAYLFQKWLSKKTFSTFTTFLIILIALFVFTFLTDIARGTYFAGFKIFLDGRIPSME